MSGHRYHNHSTTPRNPPIEPEHHGELVQDFNFNASSEDRKCYMCFEGFGALLRGTEMEDHRAFKLNNCGCVIGYSCIRIWLNDGAQSNAEYVQCPKCRTPICEPRN